MPKIDTEKLFAIRDEHARLHAEYRSASERAREALAEAQQLRHMFTPGSTAQRAAQRHILQLPVADLEALEPEVIQIANIDPRHLRRVVDVSRRADALRSQAEALAPALRRHGLLLARVNEYANSREFV